MVKIVIVKNPFCPSKDRITILDEGGKTLKEYIDNYIWTDDLYIEVNGKAVDDYHKHEHDLIAEGFIAVMPKVGKSGGGKAIIGLVASIGLAVATGGITAGGLASWGSAFAKGSWGAYAMALATTMIGGFLINKLCYKQDQSNSTTDNDPTYGWAGVQTLDTQGNGVQMTYGKVKAGGQSIQKYTTSKGSDQWFHWLVACGEGELEISDIRLNNNPISYYEDVIVDVRNGTNDQEIIPNFADTYTATQVNAELRYIVNNTDCDNTSLSEDYAGWVTQRIDSNTTEGLRVEIDFQNGLYHYSDKGKIQSAWVKIWVQYRKVNASAWTDFVDSATNTTIKDFKISKGSQSEYRQTIQLDKIDMGQYEVRVCVCSRSAKTTSTKDMTRCWWSLVESVIYDDFIYPNTALIGIKAKATAQLNSSSPTLTFVKERANVWVWNGVEYVQKKANNPAWACYDFMCGIRKLKNINTNEFEFINQGVPKDLVIYDQFNAWAEHCAEHNLEINIEINQTKDWWNICNNDIASVGRGLVVQFGTRYGCIYDHIQPAVQLFNQGNIVQGSFEMSYLGTDDRADAIELTYIDKDRDYERTQITVYSSDYDTISTPNNPTQVNMNGITSYEQAYKEAKYQLLCNKLMKKTATWKSDVEAISCMVGDVVLVASDVVQWGISGRIADYDGQNTITIPIDWDNVPDGLLDSNLSVMIRQSNSNNIKTFGVVSHTVNAYGDVDIVLNGVPYCKIDDLFVLGKVDNVAKYFTVTSIQRTKDLEYTISGLEYNEGVFDENYTIPTRTPSMIAVPEPPNITNLSGQQNSYVDGFGVNRSTLSLSWSADGNADNFTIWLCEIGEDWKIAGTTPLTDWEQDTEPNTIYQAKVEASVLGKKKMSNIITISAGVDLPPPNVGNMTQRLLNDGTRMIWWNYEYPTPNDIAGFEFRWSVNNDDSWENARKLHEGLIASQPFETLIVTPQAGCILCCAVDNAGQYSETPAVLRTSSINTLKDNVVYEKHLSDNWGASYITHNGVVNASGQLVSNSLTTSWTKPTDAKWSGASEPAWNDAGGFAPISLTASITAPASGNIWVEFNSNNRCWCDYRITTKIDDVDVVGSWQPNIQKAVVKGGDLIEIKVSTSYTELQAVISDIAIYVDTEDRTEHFEDIVIPASGLELPIQTPNYYTTGIKIDDIQTNTNQSVYYEIVTWTPCVVKFYTIKRGATYTKEYIQATADITWQGFIKEVAE